MNFRRNEFFSIHVHRSSWHSQRAAVRDPAGCTPGSASDSFGNLERNIRIDPRGKRRYFRPAISNIRPKTTTGIKASMI
jgi:hypothetical protein